MILAYAAGALLFAISLSLLTFRRLLRPILRGQDTQAKDKPVNAKQADSVKSLYTPAEEQVDFENKPISVNYHFTRKCNMTCGFCFHTATTSDMQNTEDAMKGVKLLKEEGMRKINFAGGEPFLYPKFLGHIIDYCKAINVESVSIVSNGSKVSRRFLEKHGKNIDILAISCDSFNEHTNIEIGRGTGSNVAQLYRVRDWCHEFGIKFKLNTVVCSLNWQEDMNEHVSGLAPFRWKCFQVLIVNGENDAPERLRDATKFLISDEQYQCFIMRHVRQKSIVPESNRLMAKSYLILDEYMRFLDRDGRAPSKSILEVGVREAFRSVFWDKDSFKERGGVYDWQSALPHSSSLRQSGRETMEW